MVIYKMHISAGTQSAAKIMQCKDYAVRRLYCAKIMQCEDYAVRRLRCAKITMCEDYNVKRLYCAKIVLCKACTAAGMKRKAELTCGSQQDSLAELEK